MAMRTTPNPKTPLPTPGLRPRPASMWPSGSLLAVGMFAIGLTIGWALHTSKASGATAADTVAAAAAAPTVGVALASVPTQVRAHHAGLSHPLLFCDDGAADTQVDGLHQRVGAVLDSARSSGVLKYGSVVYRSLELGRGFEIDGDRRYHPASLLKLPLAIAWMRRAEANPGILERKLAYGNTTMREAADAPGALVPGESYTARELMDRMIRWSRNDAKSVLALDIGDESIKDVYRQVEVPWPFITPETDPELTTREYSRLFRVVYDASILHPPAADELLQMLARTEYDPALKAGVPNGTQVAHKWGHRVLKNTNPQTHQLHDCGIVFKPSRPFLLCVMTEGRDEASLAKVIADVARTAWNSEL